MKIAIEKIIQSRNPHFTFDEGLTTSMLFALLADKIKYLIRGLKVIFRFKRPQFLMLGKKVKLIHLQNMAFGKWVKLEDYVYMSAFGKGQIRIGDNSGIGAFSRLIISMSFNNLGEYIHIGKNVGIGEFAYLGGAGGLEIGDDCIVGQYLSCHPENHNYDNPLLPFRLQGVNRKGIKIGSNCWIGSKVTILDGVTIGDNCIIAAGAVVNKNMSSNSIIGGVPARVIKTINPEINSTPTIHSTFQKAI